MNQSQNISLGSDQKGEVLVKAKGRLDQVVKRERRLCADGKWRSKLVPRGPNEDRIAFFQAFSKGPENKCWNWQGGKFSHNGYGSIWFRGGAKYAHKIAYEIFVGPVPAGLEVCHSCDNPACVNPNHLWLGTHLQNMRDAKNKGRIRYITGDQHYLRRRKLKGETVSFPRNNNGQFIPR